MSHKKGILALSPLVVFIVLYLVTSIVARDFNKVPIIVVFMISSIYAIAVTGGLSVQKRVSVYTRGASNDGLISMLWIFVMAGAFANSAKDMGSISSIVSLTMNLLPSSMILSGLFVAACFTSLCIGTSVGTIVALVPIAAGIANVTDVSVPFMTSIIVGGALFGDNLSFISDTTIAATQTQGCKMSDKFRTNLFIVTPAAILIILLYVFLGSEIETPHSNVDTSPSTILPYIAVLVAAICGMNVMAVLTIGIALTGVIGIAQGAYDLYGWFHSMWVGIMNMSELIIITMMAGGLLELIKDKGGIDYIIALLTRRINGKRGAELSIAALVSFTNVCTANNTIAIITVGGIAKKISERYGIDPRKSASILDTFSCFVQGLIPYGAQVLMAAGLAKITPIDILPYLYYPFAIGIAALMSILFRYPKRYS